MPSVAELKRGKQWNFSAALTLVTTPNAPGDAATRFPSWQSFAAHRRVWWCWMRRMWISRMKMR